MRLVTEQIALAMAAWIALHDLAFAAPKVTLQPAGQGPDNRAAGVTVNDPARDPPLTEGQLTRLLRQKIKYVFVIFNENHSFDNEYGTYPGVNGLYADAEGHARIPASNVQRYTDISGNVVTVRPFLIGPALNSNAIDSVNHAHRGLARKIDVVDGAARMDGFARDEYMRFASNPAASQAHQREGTQFARLVMSHIDCDTIPFYWQWASNFTIFDDIFATEDTPSAPNAIAMIAGQSGETQWVKHPSTSAVPTATGTSGVLNGYFIQAAGAGHLRFSGETGTTQGPPLVNDPQPWAGSPFDSTPTLSPTGFVSGRREPYSINANESYGAKNIASNLTFASLPLTMLGRQVTAALSANLEVANNAGSFNSSDTVDIQQDIPYIQQLQRAPVQWGWYQDGYAAESTDTDGAASHAAFVSHHSGPQYFGYIAQTPAEQANMHSETQFFADIAHASLPSGGVFYIRGGYQNQMGLKPYIVPGNPAGSAIIAAKSGDDDHPSYADRQLSEAMNARVINAIASDPKLWAHSAIILTYDESDGFYDHVPPRILAYGPDGLPLSRGIRVPLLLISPYARTHAVSHVEGDHNAVIETINAIFDLPALASLPDERAALAAGDSEYFNHFGPAGFHQKYLGPRDINSPITESLLSGFDPKRLLGQSPPLPATIARISADELTALPHYNGAGCTALGFRPVPEPAEDIVPAGFNPLPSTYPAAN
ncbi:MAG: alkaline phosphatase family protein [Steroidobacteraceae bacterium]|jgi:phospholipase C